MYWNPTTMRFGLGGGIDSGGDTSRYYTKAQKTIQSPNRIYKAPRRLYKALKRLHKDINYYTKI